MSGIIDYVTISLDKLRDLGYSAVILNVCYGGTVRNRITTETSIFLEQGMEMPITKIYISKKKKPDIALCGRKHKVVTAREKTPSGF